MSKDGIIGVFGTVRKNSKVREWQSSVHGSGSKSDISFYSQQPANFKEWISKWENKPKGRKSDQMIGQLSQLTKLQQHLNELQNRNNKIWKRSKYEIHRITSCLFLGTHSTKISRRKTSQALPHFAAMLITMFMAVKPECNWWDCNRETHLALMTKSGSLHTRTPVELDGMRFLPG